MKIRKATLKDAKACLKIRAEEDRWSAIDFVNSVKDKHCIFLVAERDSEIVGYCISFVVPIQRKEAMLHETRVVKSERKEGIGTLLVKAFCKNTFSRGVKDIFSLIEHKHTKFYCDSCGFKKNNRWIELKKSK